MFQLFTADAPSEVFPRCPDLNKSVADIVNRIGSTGKQNHKLGFVVGPLTFNQSDAQVKLLIHDSFTCAKKLNVAVAFHIDDHMFWDKNKELAQDKENTEWINSQGTLCSGRRLDWGPKPAKAPPQLCFNSPAVKAAVHKRATLIGNEIKYEIDQLKKEGREDLFAGLITGWETQIGRDFSTGASTGFHALHNIGIKQASFTSQSDAKLEAIVRDFIQMWAYELAKTGLPQEKLYSHIAFTSQGFRDTAFRSFPEQVGFATPSVVFANSSIPGFSTYPMADTIEQIRAETIKRGQNTWISAEGTNVVPNGMRGEPNMETYLAKMFNHGARLVNIFSWGMGGEAEKNNFFRRATEGDEAITAYRKFLNAYPLAEKAHSPAEFSVKKLQGKVRAIQSEVPPWVHKTGRVNDVKVLMDQLDAALKAGQPEAADKKADEVLNLIHSN